MTCVLALDCSLGGFTLGLYTPLNKLYGVADPTPRSSTVLHTELDKLFKNNGIQPTEVTLLAVTVGPGSFTGARIAMAFAEAWRLAYPSVRMVGLPTLACVARQVVAEGGIPDRGFRVVADAAGGSAYGQDFNGLGLASGAPFCLPLSEATATSLPLAAVGLPLLEGATWRFEGLTPASLMAAALDEVLHGPLEIVYLKALTYREKTHGTATA